MKIFHGNDFSCETITFTEQLPFSCNLRQIMIELPTDSQIQQKKSSDI